MDSKEEIIESRNDLVVGMPSDKESAATSGFDAMDFVNWEGPDDAGDPMNWPKWKTRTHVALVSVITFLV